MQAYRVTEWAKRYEVTKKGRKATGTERMSELRKSPPEYIRSRIYGHSIGPAMQYILDNAWLPGQIFEWAVFGLFQKILEIAGDQEREYRGWLLDKDQKPLLAASLAKMFRSHEVELFQKVLDILCRPEVGWLELAEFPDISGTFRTVPAETGDLYNEKERKEIEGRSGTIAQIVKLLDVDVDNQSDMTTLNDIAVQVVQWEVSDRKKEVQLACMVETAKKCANKDNPIAAFVERMKKPPFNYKPAGNKLGGAVQKLFSVISERRIP